MASSGAASQHPFVPLQRCDNISDVIWPLESYPLHPFKGMFRESDPHNARRAGQVRSLVMIVSGRAASDRVDRIIRHWGTDRYDWIVCDYDGTDWGHFAWADSVVIVHTRRQMKFWYLKRFVTPWTAQLYEFLHFLDADVDADAQNRFDPVAYEAALSAHGVLIAQPALSSSTNHMIVRRVAGPHVGRWTDFVECGPFFTISRRAYRCVWRYWADRAVSGYGIDLFWCRWLAEACGYPVERVCAIIDRFAVPHVNTKEATSLSEQHYHVVANLYRELGLYRRKFPRLEARMQTFGFLNDRPPAG